MITVSAHAIANAFITLSEAQRRPLTNMQVQKLVFLAHGYTLGLYDRPLYFDNTHAWQWGPVTPKLYKSLQKFGSGFVTSKVPSQDFVPGEDREAWSVIEAVWQGYGHRSGGQLSALTHKNGSPWEQIWNKERFSIIPTETIGAYYRGLVETV